jgi:hypothetical protein
MEKAIHSRISTGTEQLTGTGKMAMIAAAFFLLEGILCLLSGFYPAPDLGGGKEMLRQVAANPAGANIAAVGDWVFAILMVPAALLPAVLVKGRGSVWIMIGAMLTLICNLSHAGVSILEYLTIPMSAKMDSADIAYVLDAMNSFTGNPLLIPAMIMLLVFNIGLILIAIGLFRSKAMPLWALILVIVFFLVGHALPLPEIAGEINNMLMLLLIGWAVLRWKEVS